MARGGWIQQRWWQSDSFPCVELTIQERKLRSGLVQGSPVLDIGLHGCMQGRQDVLKQAPVDDRLHPMMQYETITGWSKKGDAPRKRRSDAQRPNGGN